MRAPQLHFAQSFHTGHTPQRSRHMEDGRPKPRPSPSRSSGVEMFHQPDEPNRRTHKSSDRPAATSRRHCRSVYTHHGQPTNVRFYHSHGRRPAEGMTGCYNCQKIGHLAHNCPEPHRQHAQNDISEVDILDLVAKAVNTALDT